MAAIKVFLIFLFEVQDQETFGLLGMEGAGKTTLLQILMGFFKPFRGTLHDQRQTLLETKYRY